MADAQVIDVLNLLLAAEYESPIPRLSEAEPFITWPAAEDRALMEHVLSDARTHQRELTELILRLRGSPYPRHYVIETGGDHYVKLSHLMPAIIESLRRLIATYEPAGGTGNAEADELISRNLTDYKRHLATLESMHKTASAVSKNV